MFENIFRKFSSRNDLDYLFIKTQKKIRIEQIRSKNVKSAFLFKKKKKLTLDPVVLFHIRIHALVGILQRCIVKSLVDRLLDDVSGISVQ